MTAALDELARYVPALSMRAALADLGQTHARRRAVLGSCVWLDVSGFTAQSERLAKRGPAGIVRLSEMLSQLYDGISSIVSAAWGDVVFFAGDGALCFWHAGHASELCATALAAAKASLTLARELGARRFADEQLEFRIAVSSGPFNLDTAGGDAASWVDVLTGPTLAEVAALGVRTPVGRASVTASSAALLGARALLEPLGDAGQLLVQLRAEPPSRTSVTRAAPAALSATKLHERAPAFVVQEPEAAQAAELRRLSVAFCQWDRALTASFERLQRAVLTLQRLAREHGGTLCQVVEDDKGLQGLVVFGLPRKAHGEDAQRAVRFAGHLVDALASTSARPRVGVATGAAFSGACGEHRRQYCVIGSTVIRAARLAQAASGPPLVDDETYQQSVRRYAFSSAKLLEVKGLHSWLRAHEVGSVRTDPQGPTRLVGRHVERRRITQALQDFARGEALGLLVIQGELGVGKTALLSQVVRSCRKLGLALVTGVADEVEQHTSFFSVRHAMRALLGTDAEQREALTELGEVALAVLLTPLTGACFAESRQSRAMAPAQRAENRRRLLAKLLSRRLGARRCVALIDDVHFIDSASCSLVRYLVRHVPSLAWVVAGRPGPSEKARLETRFGPAAELVLGGLAPAEVDELVATSQGAARLSAELGAGVNRLGRGNPLHALELTRALAASRRLQLRGGVLGFKASSSAELDEVPATLEELSQSRFDRLPSATRRVLRAASVIGASFDARVLYRVLAPDLREPEIDSALAVALIEGLLRKRPWLEFDDAAMCAVIYRSLLPSEQQQLHRRVARALRELDSSREPATVAQLSHHWQRAQGAGARLRTAQSAKSDTTPDSDKYAPTAESP